MILSHRRKFILVSNGKTGTQSMERALGRYNEAPHLNMGVLGLYSRGHIPAWELKSLLPDKIWEEYFTFCFVRNPWDWAVSQYIYNFVKQPKVADCQDYSSDLTKRQMCANVQERTERREDKEKLSCENIRDLYHFLRQYRGLVEADSLFQHNYVCSPSGAKIIDFVGRFENLAADFSLATHRLGIHVRLPHVNTTNRRPYRSYYDASAKALVAQLYREDIEMFGYSF